VRLRLVERVPGGFAAPLGGAGLRDVHEECIRGIRQAYGACYASCVPELPACGEDPAGSGSRGHPRRKGTAAKVLLPAV
jgi:hypothetical protein